MKTIASKLALLVEHPKNSAIFLDFDGTLAEIVEDPRTARPLPGVPELLGSLAQYVSLIVVLSGRPIDFLLEVLGRIEGVHLVGLYGLEECDATKDILRHDGLEKWGGILEGLQMRAQAQAPDGVYIEPKGFTIAFHWRERPEARGWIEAFVENEAELTGLEVYPGRFELELRPPLAVDKVSVVTRLGRGHDVVVVFGDDLGDIPAFKALDYLEAEGADVVRIVAKDAETRSEVIDVADMVVSGPQGAVNLLTDLLDALST